MSFHYHSQTLSRTHWRGWLHVGNHKTFGWEFGCWSKRLGISFRRDDEDMVFGLQIPPLSLHLSFPLLQSIPEGEFYFRIHDWSIWFAPWGKLWEHNRKDKWWVRGLVFDIKDFFLGRMNTTHETIRDGIPVEIPMPEGVYLGTAKVERYHHKRPRWFMRERLSTWIEVPKGIPHSGKGENSWDCGDDGIWGTGCEGDDTEKAIETFRNAVLRNRQRYGNASEGAVREALGACT